MKHTSVTQIGFVRQLKKKFEEEKFKEEHSGSKLSNLTEQDLLTFVQCFWALIAQLLYSGMRIKFEGWVSIFTKPVKRACYGATPDSRNDTYAMRMRIQPKPSMRKLAEKKLTKEEYEMLAKKEEK